MHSSFIGAHFQLTRRTLARKLSGGPIGHAAESRQGSSRKGLGLDQDSAKFQARANAKK